MQKDINPIITSTSTSNNKFKKKKSPKLLIVSILLILICIIIIIFNPVILNYFGKSLVYERRSNKADLIIVLSGGEDSRIEKAVELYDQKVAPKILMCGGGRFMGDYYANFMGEFAHKLGVRRKNIIYEYDSLSTLENAKFSYPIVKDLNTKSVLLITSKYHTKRAYKIFKKYFPDIEVFIIGSDDNIDYNKWWKNHESMERILIELGKSIFYWFQ